MSNTALGAALTIDDSVLAKIQEAENKIIRLEQTTRTSADKIAKSFRSAGDVGIQYFIDKLKLAQTELGKINVPKIDFGQSINFGQVSQQATLLAESVAKASVAINQYYSSTQKSNRKTTISTEEERKAYIQKYEMYKKMFDQIERNEKRAIKAAETEAKAQEQAAQRIIAAARRQYAEQAKLYQQQNLQQNTTYQGALSFAERASTINRRTKAIQYLTQARAQLSSTDANYTQKLKALNDAIKRMNAENERAVQGARNLAQQHSNLMNTSDQLMRKLALIFSVSQIQGYVNKLIQVRGEFELQNTALASILQNKDQADKLFGQITELAVQSPFTVKELTTYTKSLAAYQVQYEDLYDTTKMLADVASGLGVDMQRLILAFGQVKAANFLRGTETRQFTEAGINMLGELAKYYTELEGRIVSVAEVQERQFKRMISFADVEQVFKRLTSAGGMFYQMQEKQAETLKGMVSNLQDSIDIMFNSIGEANDGTLKNMVSLVKSIVDNWGIFANVLNASAVGFAAYTLKTIAASVATNAFSAANLSATASATGLNAVLAKSIVMFKNLAMWIKANPFTVWATGIAFAAYAIADHVKKVQKARESYDILSRSVQSSKKEIEGIKSRLDAANTSVLENNNIVSKLKQGTEEYKEAQEKLNKAQTEQQGILDELESKYPEIYAGLVKQENGTIDMTEAQKAYNEELQKTMTLNFLMQNEEGFFNEGIYKDLDDLSKSQKDYQNQADNLKSAYFATTIAIEKLNSTSKKFADEYYASFEKIINSQDDEIKKLTQIRKLIFNINDSNVRPQAYKIADISDDAFKDYNKAYSQYKEDRDEAERETQILIQKILEIAKVSTADTFRQLDEEAKKSAINFAKPFIDAIPSIKDKFMQEFVNEQLKVNLGVTIDFNNETPKELSSWQKRINEYIEKNNLEINPIVSDETTSAYFNNLRSQLKETQEEISKLQKATEQRGESSETNEQQIISLKKREEAIKNLLSAFGELETKEKKGKDTTSQVFKDRLSFFERANKEYEKLLQNYSAEEARAKVISSMMDEAQQRGVGGIFMSAQFDEKGTLDSFNKVKAMYTKLSEEMRIAFAKAFGGIQLDMDIEVRQDRVKAIQDQFSNLFGNYELSLELDKLGLDKDLMSQLFGVEVFDLSQLRKVLEPFKNELQNTLGKEGVSAWDEMNKKISEAEEKELQDRLKTYSQYLKKSVSERVAIEMEAQKKIAEVRATEEFTPEQQERIVTQIRQETQVKKDEQAWKEFQDSELYIKMFEDLEFASTKALDAMEQKLIEVRSSLKTLSPTELKQINDQLEKIREVKISRNPFEGLKDNIKGYIEYLKNADELNSKFIESQEKEIGLKEQYDMQLLINQETQKQYANLVKNNQENSSEGLILKEKLTQQDKILDVTLKQLVAQGKITQEFAEQIRAGEQLGSNAQKQINNIGSIGSQVVSSISEFTGMLSNWGIEFGETFEGVLSGIGQAFNGLNQIDITRPMSIVSGAISVVSGIGNAFASIFGFGNKDKKKEKEIQRQIEQVEKLEKAYEKLEEAIDSAYSIDTLERSTDQAIANLQKQNQSLQNAIAAEESKKKTDDDRIKEWQDAIESNNEAIEQLVKDQISTVTAGILDDGLSAADAFVDAWLEAFQETGDGLQGLEDNFNEMLLNMIKRQAAMSLVSPLIENMQKELEKYINDNDTELTISEAERYAQYIKEQLPEVSAALENLFNGLKDVGLEFGEGDTMTGLSKSISGITEDQADALAAITESIRFFSADSNAKLTSILAALTAPAPENPFLLELKAQTEQLRTMNSLWSRIVKSENGSIALNVRIK